MYDSQIHAMRAEPLENKNINDLFKVKHDNNPIPVRTTLADDPIRGRSYLDLSTHLSCGT